MAGPTESPFVFERDGRWYLLIGPDYDTLTRSFAETGRYDLRAYRRTRVLVSDDPLTSISPTRWRRSTPTPPRSSSTSTATGG